MGIRRNPVFSPEVYRTRVGLSATPTSFFMTVHPLQGGLPRSRLKPTTCYVAVIICLPVKTVFPLALLCNMPRQSSLISRSHPLSAKLTQSELLRVQSRAEQEGLTVSEWTRGTVLRALEVDPVTRTMMAEFLAMRRIVLTLYTELRTGGKELSAAAIDRLVADTDLRKYALADRRIRDTLGLPIEEDPATVEHSKASKENKK